jgi:hypothetical protein
MKTFPKVTALFAASRARRRKAKSKSETGYCARYEKLGDHPVKPIHGGYGVLLAEGYITGPYYDFRNAELKAIGFTNAIVVRWVDFIVESSVNKGPFRDLVPTLKEPLTVRVIGYRMPASVIPNNEAA